MNVYNINYDSFSDLFKSLLKKWGVVAISSMQLVKEFDSRKRLRLKFSFTIEVDVFFWVKMSNGMNVHVIDFDNKIIEIDCYQPHLYIKDIQSILF